MSVQVFGRRAVALSLVVLVSGCSVIDLGGSSSHSGSSADTRTECQRNPGPCMYEGPYEVGERDYAEEEARRLNRAEYERLLRSAGK
ncbi:hypothetical protein [Corticimicrobacter populi]|uniref:hypothetical protein n=1 Tax=Corticimicrobacter populi TaxID=2175229 RepID=UPI001390501B|nr:hypothetical protein [Corticimicrobacter populi]